MTDLSPAAQVAMDAALTHSGPAFEPLVRKMLASALRAAAERNEYKPDMRDEMEVMFSEGWNSHRKELLAIAAELEAYQ
jgi:hypothetical protein